MVDPSNLNRQTLYSVDDVTHRKAERAGINIKTHCITQTRIETHDLDAVSNYKEIVRLAGESSVIFNMIDYGDSYDYLMQSLATSLGLPLV